VLEQIVRPLERPQALATRRIIADNIQVAVTPAQLRWGAAGGLPSPTEETLQDGTLSFNLETCDDNFSEQNRSVDTVDVQNTADPSQSVQVERIKSISFNKKATPLVGVIRTQTTSYATDDPFAGTPFGSVPKADHCKSTFNLKNT
jgi:hypothetical protein